jgi:hypothetical protein
MDTNDIYVDEYASPAEVRSVYPANERLEYAFVGALLQDFGAQIDELDVPEEALFFEKPRLAYRHMRRVRAEGSLCDFSTVPPDDDDGTVHTTLLTAVNAAGSDYATKHYADRIMALYGKRQWMAYAQSIVAKCADGSASLDEIHELAQEGISKRLALITANPFEQWSRQGITASEAMEVALIERPYIVKDFVRAGSLTVNWGLPGELKSAVTMDMAFCVASGKPWLKPLPVEGNNQRAFETLQTNVLWINCDQSHEDVVERMAAMARAHGGGDNVKAITFPDPPAVLKTEPQARKLGRWIRSREYGLVVVDSLVDVRGDVDLKDAEMGDVLRLWWIVEEESGAAVVLISHATNETQDLYGSTFIKAKLDHAYHITRPKGTDYAVIESTKQRSCDETGKLCALWTYRHRTGTRTLESARFWGDSTGLSRGTGSVETVQSAVRAFLMNHPGRWFTGNTMTEAINEERDPTDQVESSAVRVAANRLVTNGKGFSKRPGESGENEYCFGEPLNVGWQPNEQTRALSGHLCLFVRP